MESLKQVGEIIKKARENCMLSLREMADLIHEDYSNLSKIEKGELNIKSDRLLKILNLLEIKLHHESPISEKVIDNFKIISANLGEKSIKQIAQEIKIDRLKLKKDLTRLVALKKIDAKLLEPKKPTLRKYKEQEQLIENSKIGEIIKINCESKNQIIYFRSFVFNFKKSQTKDFLTKVENELELIIVRIK
ncbi:helix-turn-helix protein [Flavobacterium croceum DSM 17960]|uniref:Helix-turn-helix protein n=1 Tax=Flavobacterium croceum DSM 17960 TaxID=1121886 RepID=A0A2S4N5C6_9FLAO|nr:helix-turn-helix transcriptional regulator [Flavobacterium croceum]POS00927.1 helix-turn-helix protein [Flavobacterium croceum DSM 17960]